MKKKKNEKKIITIKSIYMIFTLVRQFYNNFKPITEKTKEA